MRKERRNHNRGPIAPLSASPNKSPLFSHLGLHRSTLSSGGKTTGSTDSAKSVSFLSPTLSQPSVESSPRFLSASPAAIVKSPPAFPTPTLASSNSNVESYLDAKIVDAATGTVPAQKDEMELDPPAELQEGARDVPNASQSYDQFTRHRGSVAASVDSEEGWTRRPSLASAYDSSDKLSLDGYVVTILERNLAYSWSPDLTEIWATLHQSIDPVLGFIPHPQLARWRIRSNPSLEECEYSVCLSSKLFDNTFSFIGVSLGFPAWTSGADLQQVIIQSCLRMIDEEHLGHRAKSGSVDSEAGSGSRSSTTPLTLAVSTPPSSQGEDEDSKAKRRASPIDGNEFFTPDLTGLARRPSVKRMRAAKDGITPNSSPNLGQGVKDSPGKMKSRSKLAWADDDEARKSPES